MGLISYALSETSIVFRVKILNSSVTTGAGLTGLDETSAGLIISTIADNEASATTYAQTGSKIETISTLGTYAAPTATKCRFKEVDATNHKGVYEVQLADARFAVSSSKSLLVSILGASNVAETDVVIPLTTVNPYAADYALSLDNTNLAHVDSNEKIALLTATQTTIDDIPTTSEFEARTLVTASYFDPAADTVATVTTLTNLPAITSNWLTAAGINASALDGKGDWSTHAALDVWHVLSASVVTASTIGLQLKTNVDAVLSDIETDTAQIGTAGAGLSNISIPQTGLDLVLKTTTFALAIADSVADEVLTGATHNVTNSLGKRIRQLDAGFDVLSGKATAGGASSITFDSGANNTNDNIYSGDRVVITAGTGVGEHGLILSYDSGSLTATMSKAWIVQPDDTSEYIVSPADCDVELWNDNTVTSDGDWAALKAETALIVADTNELQTDWKNTGRLDAILDIIAADTTTDIPALIATAQADLNTITGSDGVTLATLQGNYAPSTVGALASLVTTVGVAGAGLTDLQLPSDGLDLVLVDGKTLPVSMQIIAAVVGGKISGAGTGTETFVGVDGSTTRVTVTVDGSGNRSAVVYA